MNERFYIRVERKVYQKADSFKQAVKRAKNKGTITEDESVVGGGKY